MSFLFSWILEFISVVKAVEKKIQDEKTKRIKRRTKDEALKESDSIAEAHEKTKNSENVVEAEKKSKKLKGQKILIDVLKFVAELFEVSIIGTLIFIGILIFFVALVVILIMFILYGFLTNTGIIPDGSIYTPDDDCIPSSQVLSQNKLSDLNLGTLQGTLTPYQQNLFKLFTLYEEFIYGNGTDYPLMRDLPPDVGYKVYRGICACETGFEFWSGPNDTSHDILKDMCVTNTSTNYVGPFAMDRRFSLSTDELMQGHKWGSDKDSNKKYVETWKNKYPKPSGDLDQYWTPYASAMTVLFATSNGTYGGLNTSSNKYDAFETYTRQRISDFGIVAKSEECYQYIRAFLSLSCFLEGNSVVTLDYQIDNHSPTKHGGKARIDFLCALFAASSDDDSKRDFNNYSIILNEDTKFSYSAFSDSILEWIYTDCTGNPFNNTSIPLDALSFSGNPRIKVGDMELTVPLVRYVYEKYNELYPQGIENMDDTWYHLKNSSGQPKAAYWYGFAALLQGNHIEAEFGISMPLTSGGNIDDCDCYEGGTSGGSLALGNRDFSNVVIGEPQGIYPDNVVQLLKQYTEYQPYYGKLDSVQNPDDILSGSVTHEQWRLDSKWKVPYQYQIGGDKWQYKSGDGSKWYSSKVSDGKNKYRGSYWKNNACPLYAQSYIYSAMTGRAVNVQEIQAAEAIYDNNMKLPSGRGPGGYDMCREAFCKMAGDAGFYVRYLEWDKVGKKSASDLGGTEGAKDNAPILYPDFSKLSLKEAIDSVLEGNGIVMVNVNSTSPFADDHHYFAITEKVGENEYKTHSASHADLDIKTHTFENIVGVNGAWMFMNDASNLMFAWNPNLSTTSGGSAGNTTTATDAEGRAKQIWDFLIQNGFSEESAAGIIGNIAREAGEGFDPSIIQNGGKGEGAGLCQWTNYQTKSSRWASLNTYAQGKGKSWDDLITQMEFMLTELPGCVDIDSFKASKDIDDATDIFMRKFERPGDTASITVRQDYAHKYYNKFKGSVTATGTGGTVSAISNFNNFLFIGDSLTNQMQANMDIVSEGADIVAEGSIRVDNWKTKYFDNDKLATKEVNMDTKGNPGHSVSKTKDLNSLSGVVIMLGSNSNTAYTAYKNLLSELLTKVSCNIYVQSVPPCAKGYKYVGKGATITDANFRDNVKKYNEEVKAFCDSTDRLYYIDTFSNMITSEGFLDDAYKSEPDDFIHLNKSGYQKQYQNILDAINAIGGVSTNSSNNSSVNCISTGSNSGVSSAGAIDLDLDVDDVTAKIKAGSWGHSYTKTRTKDEIKFIVVHYWGSQSKSSGNAQGLISSYESGGMNRKDGKTYMAQYVVDREGIYRTAPDLVNVQHAGGDNYNGGDYYTEVLKPLGMEKCSSNNSIGIEAANSDLNDTGPKKLSADKGFYVYEKGTIENLISLTKALMIEYNIDVDHIYRHYDCSMKTCPAPFIDDKSLWVYNASDYDKGESQNWKAFKECLTSDTIDWSKFNDHVVDNIK